MPSAISRRAIPSSESLLKRIRLRHTGARPINLVEDQLTPPQISTKAFPSYRLPLPYLLYLQRINSHCQPYRPSKSAPPFRAMSSDEAYSSFLDQANQDTGASKASTQSTSASTKAVDTDVPATLQKIEQYYTSEADEPFEPVSLRWSGRAMPSESTSKIVATTIPR